MMTCEVCGKAYISKSLKRETRTNFRKCDECYYAIKAQKGVAHANRKSQTETMRLERRIEKLEKKNEMLETIIESMVNDQVNAYIQNTLKSAIKKATDDRVKILQAQIIAVNNKVVEIMGFELPKGGE
jgi:CRISPR/Cas system CMR subunit Cmr6 (Cas7 group RAMP superfamily)